MQRPAPSGAPLADPPALPSSLPLWASLCTQTAALTTADRSDEREDHRPLRCILVNERPTWLDCVAGALMTECSIARPALDIDGPPPVDGVGAHLAVVR